jgi:glycosyltransferase involved in cell wall biosynthesis
MPAADPSAAPSPLRIVHCLWNGEVGGAERAVWQLVREQLNDETLAPALLFVRGGGPYFEYAQELGCPVTALGLPNGHALHRLPALVSALRGYHVHHFHSPEALVMLASTLCPGVRRVYTHRGGLTDYAARKRAQHGVAGFFLRNFFHAVSGNTGHAARSARALYRLGDVRLDVTYNGLDRSLLEPRRTRESVRWELGLHPGDYVVGTAAHLRPWKRIERLLDAVAAIDEPRLRAVVVGDGIDRPRLEAHAHALGLGARVVFAGKQLHVPDYLQTMDAFCLPSTGLESFGNAAVEAMLLGLPTLVFADGGGLTEHVRAGETGFVVDDQDELVAALRGLLADPARGRDIGARARSFVRDRYTPARSAAAYRSLYATALAGGAS